MQKYVKLIPDKLKYYCAVWVLTHATTGKYGSTIVSEVTALEALKRFGEDKGIK